MSVSNNQNKEEKSIQTRLEEINQKIHKQKIRLLLFWFVITVLLTISFYQFINLHDTPVRKLIYSLLFAVVTLNWIINIPFVGIMLIIVIRTRSRSFFYQVFPTIGLLILVTIVAFSSTIELSEDSAETIIFIGFLLILIILEAIMIRLHVNGIKNNKKPLWFYSFFQDTMESYSSTILSQQALSIVDLQDGYTQRPFFLPFTELNELFTSVDEFRGKFTEYALFLISKNELIDWEIREEKVMLYPRVLLGHADFGIGIKYLWDLLIRILKKERLTKVIIDWRLKEISLSIAREDYDWLGNVTYHLLTNQVLERFKLSIIDFIDDKQSQAYSRLFSRK